MPSSWKLVRVGDVASLLNGYAFASQGFSTGGGVPLIRIRDLGSKTTEINFVGDFPNQYVVKNGDLLIGMDGDFNVVKWNGGYALLNQRVCKLGSMDASVLSDDFLFHQIIGEIAKINRITAATTVKHLASKDVIGIELQLPPSAEQSKIAEVLSTVDRAIAQTEALIAKQQRINTGMMQDLLTRGIDQHGQLRSEATHAFKDSTLGRIPLEWEVSSLDSVAQFVTSGARGWAKYYSEEGAIFLRIGNLTRKHINLRLDDIVYVQPPATAEGTRTQVQQGDLLISVTADLGIIGVIPANFGTGYVNQHIALARLDSAKVSPRFVGWFLGGYQGRQQFDKLNESGAKAGLNLPTVRSLLFPSPELSEQTQIADMLDSGTEALTQRMDTLRKLRHLKTALMQDLLTGKVRVTPLLQPSEAARA